MICDRCFCWVYAAGEHGIGLCPFEPRRFAPVVRPDSIPGGVLIAHGLCNPDGTPRRYDSHSEIRAAAEAKGLMSWSEIHSEDSLKDARVKDDWQRSSEAKRAKRDRDEARREKRMARR
jgi:hypothetical protein